jgi:hypothetical protein
MSAQMPKNMNPAKAQLNNECVTNPITIAATADAQSTPEVGDTTPYTIDTNSPKSPRRRLHFTPENFPELHPLTYYENCKENLQKIYRKSIILKS